jgi:ribulose-5-phosphate 4-epimerase/fuculose-1-phosphate aldolase
VNEAARTEVARVARMVSRAGLVEAFGHVSARTESGFAITSTAPMLGATVEDVVDVDLAAGPVEGPVDLAPLETPLHAAVYAARPDVGGICRGHPPSVVVWGTGLDELPLLHGLGGLAGHPVRVHDDVELVTTAEAGAKVVATLGSASSVILRANGALAVGRDPVEAATRLYFLEERARVATRSAPTPHGDTATWARRLEHTEPELTRAVDWFEARFGDPPTT